MLGYSMANARERDLKNSTLAADIRKIRLLLLTFATILIWLAFDLVLVLGTCDADEANEEDD